MLKNWFVHSSPQGYSTTVKPFLPVFPKRQLDQNAAARVLTGTRKTENITPILRCLQWLPIKYRMDFKVLFTVYKSLSGLAPNYPSDPLTAYKPSRTLRASNTSPLTVPKIRSKSGEGAFSHYGLTLWNKLPDHIRCTTAVLSFKGKLKTHLFSRALWLASA